MVNMNNILDWKDYVESHRIDEGIMSNVKNWLSRNFGGSVSKIDSLLNSWKSNEWDYVKQNDKAEMEIHQLDLERASMRKDPALYKANEASVRELKKKISALANFRDKNSSLLETKIKKLVKNNDRLLDYYEMKKAKIEAELAKDLLDNYKWDKSKEDEIYGRYSEALERVKEKEKEFKGIDFHSIVRSLPSLSIPSKAEEIEKMSDDDLRKVFMSADKSEKMEILSKLDSLKTRYSRNLSEIKREIIEAKKRFDDKDKLNPLYTERDDLDEKYRRVNSIIKYLNSLSYV